MSDGVPSNSMQSQGTQHSQSQASKESKVWKLAGGTMRVLSHGKKKPSDNYTILELEFTFNFDNKPRKVVFPCYDPTFKNALGLINIDLGRWLSLEDCLPKDTAKHFPSFMLQEVILYQERLDALGTDSTDSRPYREYSQPTVEKFEGRYFLFASDVFDLSDGGKKLSSHDAENIPVRFSYTGKEFEFKTDTREAFEILMRIINNGNQMQERESYSFILASFVAHLSGELYVPIIDARGNFSMHMTVSGDATDVGKSLFQTIWINAFKNGEAKTLTSITQAQAYEMLADGKSIYVKEFSLDSCARSNQIGPKFVKWALQTLWERSGSANRMKKDLRPSAIVHIDANVMPQDILKSLDPGMRDKIYFIYTGKNPLEHPDSIELIDKMLKDSKLLYFYLPVLLSMGIETLLARVPNSVVKELHDILPKPNDRRAAQVFFSYDNVYKYCKANVDRYELEAPPLFESEDIDRTALLSHKMVDTACGGKLTKAILEAIKDKNLGRFLDISGRRGFKLSTAAIPMLPVEISAQLMHVKKVSTTFEGEIGQKVVFLPVDENDSETIDELKIIVNSKYKLWLRELEKIQIDELKEFEQFLYSKMTSDDAGPTSDQLLYDSDSEQMDGSTDQLDDPDRLVVSEQIDFPEMHDEFEEENKQFRCSKKACKRFNTVFEYETKYNEHTRTKYHRNAPENDAE